MSNCKKVTTSVKSFKRLVKKLKTFTGVEAIYLVGSRSNKTTRKPRDNSDWDIIVISDIDGYRLFNPREKGILCADLTVMNEESFIGRRWKAKAELVWSRNER